MHSVRHRMSAALLAAVLFAISMTLSAGIGQAGERIDRGAASTFQAATGTPDFVPLSPVRLVDSRAGQQITGKIPTHQTRGMWTAGRGGVPQDAQAVTLNVTVTETEGSGHLIVFPCNSPQPLASTINYGTGATVPNQVTVKLGSDGVRGDICLYSWVAAHVVVDVAGYFPAGSDYRPLAPVRLADTRPGQPAPGPKGTIAGAGTILSVPVAGAAGIGQDAAAAVLNVAVIDPQGHGYLTVFPCGEPVPLASTLNHEPKATVANAVTVKLGAAGRVCIYSHVPAHVLVDVGGWFPAGTDLAPRMPVRIADTRLGEAPGWQKGLLGAGKVLEVPVIGLPGVPNGASTAVLNVAITTPAAAGWLVAYPCRQEAPLASNLNFTAGMTVANAVVSKVGPDGRVCLRASTGLNVIVDLLGHYAGPARPPQTGSTFVRAATSPQVFAVEPSGSMLPVGSADLAALGNPAVAVYNVVPGTAYQRSSWSGTVFAVPPSGSARPLALPEYLALGTPAVEVVPAVRGTNFVKTANSPSVYAIEPDGAVKLLTEAQRAQLRIADARVVTAAPGSRFVKTERSPDIYALAPDGTTRRLSGQEYAAVGSPAVETLLWQPVRHPVAGADVWASYRAGCPVTPTGLTRFEFPYWDFSGRRQTGSIIAATGHIGTIEATMRSAYDAHFPLQAVAPVERYGGNDEASMAAGNTSAFNCRPVVGNPTRLSGHSFGNAIDINPAQNPYVTAAKVYPPGSDTYLNRGWVRDGMHFSGGPIVGPLSGAGWYWGARWNLPDYHHFSSDGR